MIETIKESILSIFLGESNLKDIQKYQKKAFESIERETELSKCEIKKMITESQIEKQNQLIKQLENYIHKEVCKS